MHVNVYIIHLYKWACVYVYTHICNCVCMGMCMYVCVYVNVCIYKCVRLRLYKGVCVCIKCVFV